MSWSGADGLCSILLSRWVGDRWKYERAGCFSEKRKYHIRLHSRELSYSMIGNSIQTLLCVSTAGSSADSAECSEQTPSLKYITE